MSVNCDKSSHTVIMTANNDLCVIMQESLFGKLEFFTVMGVDR